MKLTKLRLLGFKSFVEPTDFLIEPGLTGVVGPNGCGKSNLVEALRWVMGETSHKSMRAADMEDVIFSGNSGRPPRNNAEVAMAIDNTDRSAPSQFNGEESLEVSRRIERDKGSTYRSPTHRPARAPPRWCIKAASARSSRPSPSSAAACWKKPPESPGCTRAATKPSCGCAPPSRISPASRT